MRYTTSMMRAIRNEEKRRESLRIKLLSLSAGSGGIVCLALFYALLQVADMSAQVRQERESLDRVKAEYSRYQAQQASIDQEDIERLNTLQKSGIIWTKKLAAMASHLPENYWITRFGYDGFAFSVQGCGILQTKQDQLITINDYLNALRRDSLFSDAFPAIYLNTTRRFEMNELTKVSFDFSAEGISKGPPQ
jgi:Tfp pilus assembly protein PilN